MLEERKGFHDFIFGGVGSSLVVEGWDVFLEESSVVIFMDSGYSPSSSSSPEDS